MVRTHSVQSDGPIEIKLCFKWHIQNSFQTASLECLHEWVVATSGNGSVVQICLNLVLSMVTYFLDKERNQTFTIVFNVFLSGTSAGPFL